MKLITGMAANCVARTPGGARDSSRGRWPARGATRRRGRISHCERSASDLAICALACDSVASAARNSLSRLPRSLCACSRSARFPAPVAASAVNCSTRFFARSIRGVSDGFLGYGVIELILHSAQRGLGGFHRRLEGHRVDLEKHIAFLDRPVWLNRHLGHLPSSRAAQSG